MDKISDIELTPEMIKVLTIMNKRPLTSDYARNHFSDAKLRAFILLSANNELVRFEDPYYKTTGIAEDWLSLYRSKKLWYWIPVLSANLLATLALIISILSWLRP